MAASFSQIAAAQPEAGAGSTAENEQNRQYGEDKDKPGNKGWAKNKHRDEVSGKYDGSANREESSGSYGGTRWR